MPSAMSTHARAMIGTTSLYPVAKNQLRMRPAPADSPLIPAVRYMPNRMATSAPGGARNATELEAAHAFQPSHQLRPGISVLYTPALNQVNITPKTDSSRISWIDSFSMESMTWP